MGIFQLPDALANKIAAGEVVERPASVVKELIENSIDAGSTFITIDLAEAGLQMIKVTDNGAGMTEEDAEKAFLRHATSKIKNETDLFRVHTLGFRGEALASIAAVSRLTVKTSQGDHAGTYLSLEGGVVKDRSKSDARKGTEITVEDLFFNTPARLKYMKTIHTELGHITDLLNRLALSHPGIRFELRHNNKSIFKTTGSGDLLQVISQVYGMGTARKMLPIQHETLDFSINGYIAKPEVTRASRNYISTIINGRYIKSMQLTQAIIRGYHTLLPIGRSPIVVLAIEMDPILVDVNVHPTKLEARFSKDQELVTAIEETIRSTFRRTSLIPEMEQKKPEQHTYTIQDSMPLGEVQSKTLSDGSNQRVNEASPVMEHSENVARKSEHTSVEPTIESVNQDTPREVSYAEAPIGAAPAPAHPDEQERIPVMYPIGQLHGTYILAQNENGFYMIDQHAAQERIKFEQFREKLGQAANEVQDLLIPLTFDFSKQEAIFIDQNKDELAKVGLFFEPFGNQSYIIRSYPTWFPEGFAEEIIREMIEQIMQHEKVDVEAIREDAAALMSCKRSIKANHYLNQQDMTRLLEDLRKSRDPFTCPHGRPIVIHFSSYELEKMFKRVM
ncbi:DNA mismatch repair endonuclease MutL [Lentibacillus cibarius]|uniref:DNA mismatch repair protein MutL n=1 Tax=Lentibacillus cibarius TaxID=2583219 RepID=A0A5S3R844_9BACI|nr:DNA mismatch repair endonuclease MutL [Lentibacillus cibarius]TMN23643.1 DNA mismatch repair endonuclease MutL [Lentibacillus cibarius]